jgi:hypothetical protein
MHIKSPQLILVEHTIDTGQALPVKQHPRRVPLSKIQEAEAEIEKMAEQEIIEPDRDLMITTF